MGEDANLGFSLTVPPATADAGQPEEEALAGALPRECEPPTTGHLACLFF